MRRFVINCCLGVLTRQVVTFALQLLKLGLFLPICSRKLCLFFFASHRDGSSLLHSQLKVSNPACHTLTLLSHEWLSGDLPKTALDTLPLRVDLRDFLVDVRYFLSGQLEFKVIMLELFVCRCHIPDLLLNFTGVLLCLLEDVLIAREVVLKFLYFNVDVPRGLEHVLDFGMYLLHVFGACQPAGTLINRIHLLLQPEHFSLVDDHLCAQIFSQLLVLLGHLSVRHFQFARNVGILVGLRRRLRSRGQSPVDYIELADAIFGRNIFLLQLIKFFLQVSLHLPRVIHIAAC
jgi:hypothetical protein